MNQPVPYDPTYFGLKIEGDMVIATFLSEQLTEEDNLEQLGQEMFTLPEQFNYLKVIADLGPLRYVTSAVLGKFITMHRKLGRVDGRLVLCNIHPDLEEVLSTSRLLTYFETAKDVDAARDQLAVDPE